MNQPTDDENTPPPAPPVPPVPPVPGEGAPRVSLGGDGATQVPAPPSEPFWKKIPLKFLIIGGVILVIAIGAYLAGRGKTSADDIQAGDCFASAGVGEIGNVTDQSCDGLHNTEAYAVVNLPASASWPGADFIADDSGAEAACTAALDAAFARDDVNIANAPDDTESSAIFPVRDGWDDGDRKVVCLIESASGFPGRVVTVE